MKEKTFSIALCICIALALVALSHQAALAKQVMDASDSVRQMVESIRQPVLPMSTLCRLLWYCQPIPVKGIFTGFLLLIALLFWMPGDMKHGYTLVNKMGEAGVISTLLSVALGLFLYPIVGGRIVAIMPFIAVGIVASVISYVLVWMDFRNEEKFLGEASVVTERNKAL